MNNTTLKKSNEIENSKIFKSSTFSSTKLNLRIFKSSLLTLSSTGGGACQDISTVGRKQLSSVVIPQNKANRLRNVSSEPVYAAPSARRRATFNSSLLTVFAVLLCLLVGGTAWGQTAYHSYTATAGTAGNSNSEGYASLVDNNTSTKWCIVQSGSWSTTAYIEFHSASPIIPVKYVLTTANDNVTYNGRSPKTWVIKAKVNSNDNWTTIASESNNTTMQDVNYTPYTFNCNNTSNTAYQYFRFEISAIQATNHGVMQLSELHFLVGESGGDDSDCEDFNSTSGTSSYSTGGILPSGWHRIYGGTTETGGTVYDASATSPANMPHVVTTSATTPGAPNSSNYISFYSSGSTSTYSYTIMPPVESGAISHLSFKYKFESTSNGTLTYGIISGTDASTYTVLGTISNPSSNPGTIDVDLNTSQTTGKRIAFRWYKSGTWYTCGIDDVCVTTTSSSTSCITTISSTADWEEFCSNVNNGICDYAGYRVKLEADISVTTMAGAYSSDSDYKPFSGIFDGQGHTITINVSDQTRFAAPFKCVDGATIRNLRTAGSISGVSGSNYDGKLLAGVVGVSFGNTKVIGCSSSIALSANHGDDSAFAGIVAAHKGSGTLQIEGCVFTGSMSGSYNGTTNNRNAGIMGYQYDNAGPCTITNSFFAPSSLNVDTGNADYSGTIARLNTASNPGATPTITNCYYTTNLGTLQGTKAHTITGVNTVTVAMGGSATATYEAIGLSFYSGGLVYNDIIYGGNGNNLSLSLSYGGSGDLASYSASNGTLTGTAITGTNDAYTLAMPDANVEISAQICGAITSFPWTETFESYASGNFTAPCWVNEHISGSGTNIFNITTSGNGNSTHQIYLPDMYDGTLTKLMLPEFNFGGVAHQFVLDVYRNSSTSNYGEGIRVFASSDGNIEGATELGFISRSYATSDDAHGIPAESTSGWYTYELDIPLTGTCYIILRGESKYGSSTYMDNFIVKVAPTCPKPTNLTVSNITTSSAKLAWDAGGAETQWQYLCADHGFTPDWSGANVITSNTHSNVPSNINAGTGNDVFPNTEYDFYVRANCGGGDYSEPIMITFRTECEAIEVTELSPWEENFDEYNTGAYSGHAEPLPDCFNAPATSLVSEGYSPFIYADYNEVSSSGSGTMQFKTYYSQDTIMLVLPRFTNELNTLEFNFEANALNASTNEGTMDIGYITNASDTSTFVPVYQNVKSEYSRGLNPKTKSMGPYYFVSVPEGTQGKIAIRFIGKSGVESDTNLDDFRVSIAPSCIPPTNLDVSNITTTDADLSWNGNSSNYNVRLFFDDFESGIGNWTTITNGESGTGTDWQAFNLADNGWPFTPPNGTDNVAMARCYSSDDAQNYYVDNWLITPRITIGDVVEFWMKGGGEEHYEVLVSTTGISIDDFRMIAEGNTGTGGMYGPAWTKVTVPLDGYSGRQGYVAVRMNDSNHNYLLIDDFIVYATTSTASYSLTNLTPSTTNTAYVRSDCGEGDFSDWVSIAFATECYEEVALGSGEDNNNYIPSYSYYNYSLTQQIYTVSEVGEQSFINGISFYNGGSTKMRTYDIYLVHTSKSAFENASDWITVSASDKVFSGRVTMLAGAWTSIVFDTPFIYNGTSNLAVIMDDNTGNYTSSPHMACRVYDASSQALRVYSDGTNYNPLDPSSYSGTVMDVKNQVKFCITPIITVCEDFGDYAGSDQPASVTDGADILPNGWTQATNGTNVYTSHIWNGTSGGYNSSFSPSGDNKIAIVAEKTKDTYVILPRMDLSNIVSISFYAWRENDGMLSVGYITGDPFATFYEIEQVSLYHYANTPVADASNSHFNVDLSDITGNYYLAFKWHNENVNPWSCAFVSEICISKHLSPTSVEVSSNQTPLCLGSEATLTATTQGFIFPRYTWTASPSDGADLPAVNSNITSNTIAVTPNTEGYTYTCIVKEHGFANPSSTDDLDLEISVPSGEAVSDIDDNDLVWIGGTIDHETEWGLSSNWIKYNASTSTYTLAGDVVPSDQTNVFLASFDNGCTVTDPILDGDASAKNLTISGATLTVPNGKTLSIAGSISGTITAESGSTIEFVGSSDQTINDSQTFSNVTFNKDGANEITATGGLIVNGTATFTKGIVTGNVTFGSGATVSGASTSSYVNGKVTRNGMSGAFTFPTGTATLYAPFKATSSSASNVSVQYVAGHDGMPDWWNHSGNLYDAGLNHASDRENWQLSASASTELSSIILYWNESDNHSFEEGNEALNSYLNVAAVKRNGFNWQNLGRASIEGDYDGSGSITAAEPLVIEISGAKAAGEGDYFVTFASSNNNLVLPIELLSFTATCDGRSALVEWTTATERNNDYFVLERSDDAINFTEVARVAGAGNSIDPIDYAYTDYGIHGGDNYYRLVQVDYDGTRAVSDIVVVNCIETAAGEPDVQAYPNPFDGELTLELDNFDNRPARIDVYDMLGKLIYTDKVASPQNYYETVLNLSNLPPATYTVRVSTADFVINKKVVKQ